MIFFFQIQTLQNTNMLLKNIQTKERDEKKTRNKENKTTKESGAG